MKYIIQINTGNLIKQKYTSKEVISKLEFITNNIDISKVILGWNNNKENNLAIVNYLHSKNIEAYFWLPINAEIVDFSIERKLSIPSIFDNNTISVDSNDTFEFADPSDDNVLSYIINTFNTICDGIPFDGVFLDRIRYNSPAVNKNNIFGCQCEESKQEYKRNLIDINSILSKDIYDKLIPISNIKGIYEYSNDTINNFMDYKRNVITRQVTLLYKYFHNKGYKVGLDIFAPMLCDFVGQNIIQLSQYSDFLKPMCYLNTTAPAGIPFELNGLTKEIIKSLEDLWNTNFNSIEGITKVLNNFKDMNIYPGIDVNYKEGICHSTEEYVIEFLSKLKDYKEVVLSWDGMSITDSLLSKIKGLH